MSAVVRMEMPTKDKACGMAFDFDGIWYCPVEQRICHQPDYREIPSWCPIICSLPDGHGDLIDRDVLLQTFQNADYETYNDYCEAFDSTEAAETIVPAEAERSET